MVGVGRRAARGEGGNRRAEIPPETVDGKGLFHSEVFLFLWLWQTERGC